MYEYKVSLHNGEVFIFTCPKALSDLLMELNTCSDNYMRFGEHIRQKNAVVGLDLLSTVVSGGGDSVVEEEEN